MAMVGECSITADLSVTVRGKPPLHHTCQRRPRGVVIGYRLICSPHYEALASMTGFEPAIISLTGRDVRPLHHIDMCGSLRPLSENSIDLSRLHSNERIDRVQEFASLSILEPQEEALPDTNVALRVNLTGPK